jgi:hypothetical protein
MVIRSVIYRYIPVIPAIQEAEIGRIVVQGKKS